MIPSNSPARNTDESVRKRQLALAVREKKKAVSIKTPPRTKSPFRPQLEPTSSHGSEYHAPLIYAVPTTDTTGDESLIARPHAQATPSRGSRLQHPIASAQSPLPKRKYPFRKQTRHRPFTHRDFQHERDYAACRVQTVSATQRSAFERRPLPPLRHDNKRVSPSYQHLQVLHKLQQRENFRQLHFSPSVGQDADLLPWDSSSTPTTTTDTDTAMKEQRTGRYQCIDVVRPTLPNPQLSNKKLRLPMRADVGFPNASHNELLLKQREIQNETEWEESSPRLAVLVTSDDLGVLSEQELAKPTKQHLAFNGGGVEGIPFAGRELMQAKERNARQLGQTLHAGLSQYMDANPYSILAPPLDASYSPSQGWRPRPFQDRPAGMRYLVACPLNVSFGVGNVEPLVCSLTLYTLPTNGLIKRGQAFGKMSEDFWFPAGDWKGKAQFEGAQREDGFVDEVILSAWMEKKQKAIFSYDPVALTGGLESISVLLQVYRLANPAGLEMYFGNHASDTDTIRRQTNLIFNQFGTSLLSPLCFGCVRLFRPDSSHESTLMNENIRWPSGEARRVDLHAYPAKEESQEAFVVRLAKLVCPVMTQQSATEKDRIETISNNVVAARTTNLSAESARKKKLNVARLFHSQKAAKVRSSNDSTASSNDSVAIGQSDDTYIALGDTLIDGSAKIYVSTLTSDFLQAMLLTPPEWDIKANAEGSYSLPKLLCDVSGDCAVLLDPNKSQHDGAGLSSRKRSNLLRLPIPREDAGYIAASEFREVLYLPPRPEKHYDVDEGLSYRSLLNVLFLYPRLLRLVGDFDANRMSNFTLRIRVTRSIASADDETVAHFTKVNAFHNASPWTGPCLVDEVFTRIIFSNHEEGRSQELHDGVTMRDEIKLRLPQILDSSYTLEFKLFTIDAGVGGNLLRESLAQVSIPLSSSASRDSLGHQVRVATVIPNGNHRLKLGAFQLQLESRLVSSIHVGDPNVATVLRDFPCPLHGREDWPGSPGGGSAVDEQLCVDESFALMLSTASPGTIAGHFEILLYIHMCNLVGGTELGIPRNIVLGSMRSFLALMHRLKLKFVELGDRGRLQLDAFIKKQLDAFDEGILISNHWRRGPRSTGSTDSSSVIEEIEVEPDDAMEHLLKRDNADEEKRQESAVRVRTKVRKHRYHALRVSRIIASMGPAGVPFSRVAYGASKLDRMRIEAEALNDQGFAYFFDDDETIFTTPTIIGVDRDAIEEKMREVIRSRKSVGSLSGNSITRGSSAARHAKDRLHDGGLEFAQRVRTAAQVMLAPCVGPSLANIIAHPSPKHWISKDESESVSCLEKRAINLKSPTAICYPGSDVETGEIDEAEGHPTSHHSRDVMLLFSIGSVGGEDINVTSGKYLYESVMVLWLKEWVDHVEYVLTDPNDERESKGKQFVTFAIPLDEKMSNANPTIFSYFVHMDFLLPLCLKSISLRYVEEVLPPDISSTKAVLDDKHMIILEPFIEMLARGLVGQALGGLGDEKSRDESLLKALQSSKFVLDFLVGLVGLLHPAHMYFLVRRLFTTLRDCETEQMEGSILEAEFVWSEENLHRVRCSRQLRIGAVERLAVLPSFLALNYPPKYSVSSESERLKSREASWIHKVNEIDADLTAESENRLQFLDGVHMLPSCGWLAQMLITEGLSVCALSCEAVVAEAMSHILQTKTSPDATSDTTKRPGAALSRADLLMLQSLAIQAITTIYELVLRRHAMDIRYQMESCRERIAGLFAVPILEKSICSVRWLARMESTHKVRSIWLLCFVCTLQEAPEALVNDYVRGLCNPKARIVAHRRIWCLNSPFFTHVNLFLSLGIPYA
jgi:hypothetical protein